MKKVLLVLALALSSTGCIGPNNAYNSVLSWNSRAADSKWLNEGIFLGLNIIPVYGFALLGDLLIFNSIEFWGGENPISDPEPFTPVNEPAPMTEG